jgi:hypothetical protein
LERICTLQHDNIVIAQAPTKTQADASSRKPQHTSSARFCAKVVEQTLARNNSRKLWSLLKKWNSNGGHSQTAFTTVLSFYSVFLSRTDSQTFFLNTLEVSVGVPPKLSANKQNVIQQTSIHNFGIILSLVMYCECYSILAAASTDTSEAAMKRASATHGRIFDT